MERYAILYTFLFYEIAFDSALIDSVRTATTKCNVHKIWLRKFADAKQTVSVFLCVYAQIYLKFCFISKAIIYFLYENITAKKCFVRSSRDWIEGWVRKINIIKYYMNRKYIRTLRIILWYILVLFLGMFWFNDLLCVRVNTFFNYYREKYEYYALLQLNVRVAIFWYL